MGEKVELTLISQLNYANSITDSVRTIDTVDSTSNLFRHESSLQHSRETVDPSHPTCKVSMLILLQLLVITISVVAIVLSILAFTHFLNENDDIKMLEKRILMLEQMTNVSKENQTEVEYNISYILNINTLNINEKIKYVEGSVNTLNEQLNRSLYHLENLISEASMQVMHKLRDNIEQLNATIGDNLGRITAINDTINRLDSQIEQTEDDTNTTANLYDNCIVDHEMCGGVELSNIYWRVCATPYLPLNVTGYFTVDMKCDYESNYPGNMVSTVLQKRSEDGTVQCKCNVLLPDHFRDNFFTLPYDFSFVCSLNITRCPLSFLV